MQIGLWSVYISGQTATSGHGWPFPGFLAGGKSRALHSYINRFAFKTVERVTANHYGLVLNIKYAILQAFRVSLRQLFARRPLPFARAGMSNRQNDDSNLAGLMANIGLHQHLCLIYETRDEQFSTAIPFLRAGLDRGEKCLYVADSRSTNAIVNEMQTQGIHVNANTNRAQLEFESSRKIYLVNDSFSADRMIEFLAESVQAAKSSGFSALRGVGKMNWVTQTKPRPEGLIEYEAKLNRFLAEQDAAIMCQYDR